MKHFFKILFLAIPFIGLFASHASAQEQKTSTESRLTPKFGIKGGLNLTKLYIDNVKDENIKAGGNAGVFVKLPITKGFSIQPEVLYSMKGSQNSYSNIFASGNYRFNLDYLEVPLAAVINLSPNFNIHAGPYIAFLLSAKVKDVDNNGNVNSVTSLNKDNFKSTDYGFFGGLGFDIGTTTLGARYTYGLQEIGKSGLSGNITQNSKNSVISFFVGFGL